MRFLEVKARIPKLNAPEHLRRSPQNPGRFSLLSKSSAIVFGSAQERKFSLSKSSSLGLPAEARLDSGAANGAGRHP